MPTLDELIAKSGELTQQQKRAARLRAAQKSFSTLEGRPGVGNYTERQQGGWFPTVSTWRPDYAQMANQAVGALGGWYADKKAGEAEADFEANRNAEILRAAEGLGRMRQGPSGGTLVGNSDNATEQALRGYLSVIGGSDLKDLVKGRQVRSTQKLANGNLGLVTDQGIEDTGIPFDYNSRLITDPVTGEVTSVGTSGSGRGVASPVTMGQPNTAAPPQQLGGVMAPDMGGPKPQMDVPEVNENVRAMLANGVAFMQSIGLPQEQQDAWVAEQIGKARTAQTMAQVGQGGVPPARPAAQGGAPLRVSGAGDIAAAKTQAEIATQVANTGALAGIEGAKVQARNEAEKRVELASTLPRMKSLAEGMSAAIDRLATHKGLDNIVQGSIMGAIPNEGNVATVARGVQTFLDPEGANAMALYDNVVGKVYQQAFETLRGGGQITEKETERTANAYARLQRAQSKAQFQAALQELKSAINDGYERMRQYGMNMGSPAPAAAPAAPTRPALPAGFEWGD